MLPTNSSPAVVAAVARVQAAQDRLDVALRLYDVEVAELRSRGDGIVTRGYRAARKEACDARAAYERSLSALRTARFQQAAPTLFEVAS